MMQSRENGQKPQFGQFFDDFEVKYLQIANFSEKQVSFKLKVIFSTNFRSKTKKIVTAVFEKNIKVSDFGLIWRPFREEGGDPLDTIMASKYNFNIKICKISKSSEICG